MNFPPLMKAVVSPRPLPISDGDSFVEVTLPTPTPGPRDLLVRVKAISVNPVDFKIRVSPRPEGRDPIVLGWDAAGIVESVGTEVTLFKAGDEVIYAGEIDRPGSNAEFQLVDERIVGRKPRTFTWEQSAALPLTAITAWESLFDRLEIRNAPPATILIVGAAGGVGSMAIQLVKRLTPHRVVATASRPESAEWCRKLGADEVLDHSGNWAEQAKSMNLGNIRFILGLTHSDTYQKEFLELIEPQGKIVLIDDPEAFDIVPFKAKSVSVGWELMFTRTLYATADRIEQGRLLNRISELTEAGKIVSTLTTPLAGLSAENFRRAHRFLESGRSIGKIVISI